MDEALIRQMAVDEEHLRLLPVFYWVLGALDVLLALYGFVYIGLGYVFATMSWETASAGSAAEAPPEAFGWFFVLFGVAFVVFFGAIAALQILTGFWIRARKHRTLCLVSAGLSCLFVPFGTLLGVLTFLALLRPSVAERFDASATAPAGAVG